MRWSPVQLGYRWAVIAMLVDVAITVGLTELDWADVFATVIASGMVGFILGVIVAVRLATLVRDAIRHDRTRVLYYGQPHHGETKVVQIREGLDYIGPRCAVCKGTRCFGADDPPSLRCVGWRG